MNSLKPYVVCFDRRMQQRRKLNGLQAITSGFEPNPFSRRMGTDRRNTIVVYGPRVGLNLLTRTTIRAVYKEGM